MADRETAPRREAETEAVGELDRRRALQLLLTATSLPLVSQQQVEALVHLAPALQLQAREQAAFELLSGEEEHLLEELSECILPATDTPGARAAGVARFIDRMLAGWFPEEAASSFRRQLTEFERSCRERDGSGFAELDAGRQRARLEELEAEALAAREGRGFSPRPSGLAEAGFFDVLKWLTVLGYYTSEVGMKAELDYRVVPGRYQPCVDA